MTGKSQYGFMKGKMYLTNLTDFSNEVISSVVKESAIDVCLNKAFLCCFSITSLQIQHGLGNWAVRWTEN